MKKEKLRKKLPYRPCVGIVVFNQQGKVWAGRRISNSETPSDYRWQFPQGGIDKGEEPLPAAMRELFEETGIKSAELLAEASEWLNYDLPDDLLGIGLKGKYRGQTQKWFAFRFVGDEKEVNITEPPDGSHPEFDTWAWRNMHEMPGLIVPFKREIYSQVAEIFQGFAQ